MNNQKLGLIIVMVLALVLILLNQYYSQSSTTTSLETSVKHYSFNEEIRTFPLETTSITFTEWRIIRSATDEINYFVRISYTVRNISDQILDLNSFSMLGGAPILDYGNDHYAYSFYEMNNYWEFNGDTPSQLMPNQAVSNGILQYEIPEGSQPVRLLHPNQNSPKIAIAI